MIMQLRKSIVMQYYKCPYRVKLSVLHPEVQSKSIAMLEGTKFHKIAEELFDKINRDNNIEDELDKLLPKEAMYDNFKQILLDKYYSLKDKNLFYPLHTEQFLTQDEVPFVVNFGTVDRIDKTEDGEYVVVDYKTSNYFSKSDIRFELCMYKMLIDQTGFLDKPVKYISAIFPRKPKGLPSGVFFEEVHPLTISATKRKVLKCRNDLDNLDNITKKNRMWCDWCPYLDYCLEEEVQI